MFNVAEILKVVNDNYYGVVAIRHLAEDEVEEATELFNKALEESGCYCGRAVVIAGERCSYGEDLNEVIIEDAVVIAVEE